MPYQLFVIACNMEETLFMRKREKAKQVFLSSNSLKSVEMNIQGRLSERQRGFQLIIVIAAQLFSLTQRNY